MALFSKHTNLMTDRKEVERILEAGRNAAEAAQ
jgi:hypothetical protein